MLSGIAVEFERTFSSLSSPFSPFLFIAFGTLVIHVGLRLIEHTALIIEHAERKAAIARASICIGSLVWALDVSALFLHDQAIAHGVRLIPATCALLITVGVARVTVPVLPSTLKRRRVLAAALGLAMGMTLAHFALMTSVGEWVGVIRWDALSMYVILLSALAAGIALRHRSAKLRAIRTDFQSLFWYEKVIGGIIVLPLHLCMFSAFEVIPTAAPSRGGGMVLLLVLVVFAVTVSAFQISQVRADEKRQLLLNQDAAFSRSVRPTGLGDSPHELSLIAERLPLLFGPGSIRLHFQPIFPVRRPHTGIRFEALLRTKHRDLGDINPELVFLACERMGKTACADRAVIVHALECSAPWVEPENGCCGVSVNVSPATMREPGFVTWLAELLEKRKWPENWLQLEITEHAMIVQPRSLIGVLEQLRRQNVSVVMDDFGAGFSCLTLLGELPIQGVKCDQAFIRGIVSDPPKQILLHHVCQMSQNLGLSVTAEGVETNAEFDAVREKGVDSVQGYLLARAMPHDDVPTWLATYRQSQSPDRPAR